MKNATAMKIRNADISWLESGLPFSSQFDDVYYSRADALAESLHVFLDANKLEQRWHGHDSESGQFTIAELGFGSGLNFLQVCKLWSECIPRPAHLHYLAFEKHPITVADLQRLYQLWPQLKDFSNELLETYPEHSSGCHRLQLSNNITLDLYYGDATLSMQNRHLSKASGVDCWFLDGFSPRLNPQLWSSALFELVAAASHCGTTLSSYSVAGKVRKRLGKAGFQVEKLQGFGKKRHMLYATRQQAATAEVESALTETPWFQLPATDYSSRSALVIGAGLAGCSTAYSLATRGWQVDVVEKAATAAAGASGNQQLALRCRLFRSHSPLAEYFLHCFLFAHRQFERLLQQHGSGWHNCGVIQLHSALNKRSGFSDGELEALYSEQVLQAQSRHQASLKAGVAVTDQGWYLPLAGWVEPQLLCQAYLSHPNITVHYDSEVHSIDHSRGRWHATGTTELAAQVAVICNGHHALDYQQSSSLPLSHIRGQTTEIRPGPLAKKLAVVVCGDRTTFPAYADRQTISASYASDDVALQSSDADNADNIAIAANAFVDPGFSSAEIIGDRVSRRCNASDFVPVVGMLPDQQKMGTMYEELGRNAKARFTSAGGYHRGLYINVAHGSNGLASCPLSGDYLASLISGENSPLSQQQMDCLSPARFLIRDLKKQKRK